MKVCNYDPSYPQRYTVGILLDKNCFKKNVFRDPVLKHKWEAKVKSEEWYKTGNNKWVFLELLLLGIFVSTIKN